MSKHYVDIVILSVIPIMYVVYLLNKQTILNKPTKYRIIKVEKANNIYFEIQVKLFFSWDTYNSMRLETQEEAKKWKT